MTRDAAPAPVHLSFDGPPGVLRSMGLALLPRPEMPTPLVPPMRGAWHGIIPGRLVPPSVLRELRPMEGGAAHPVLLHAGTMRLMMALLTHPRFPVPIWNILQVRNSIRIHRAVPAEDPLEAVAEFAGQRKVEKGLEVDLRVHLLRGDHAVQESLTVFLVRGRSAGPGVASSTAPRVSATEEESLRILHKGALGFGRLTGDFNGIHWWSRYARNLGFQGAFSHPHRALARILESLPGWEGRSGSLLEVWYKGPVYYDRDLRLSWSSDEGRTNFALRVGGDPRPAIAGTWTEGPERPPA
ncbi:MAG: hypothetical protein HY823_04700 [Acidobacteria bacterium]|nr:hypothetical protein [Acidobacteriota bacterium]